MKSNNKKNEGYLVKIPHTREGCLKTLDEIKLKGQDVLSNFKFGCSSGDHTSYAMFENKTESEIRNMLPGSMAKNASFTPISSYSLQEIEEMHREKSM